MPFFERDTNFTFDISSWKKIREKGFVNFGIVPSVVVFIFSLLYSFMVLDRPIKIIILSAFSFFTTLVIFVLRVLTWFWKEYMYKRSIGKKDSTPKLGYIFNVIRIVVSIFSFISILYFMSWIKGM